MEFIFAFYSLTFTVKNKTVEKLSKIILYAHPIHSFLLWREAINYPYIDYGTEAWSNGVTCSNLHS